MNLLTPGFQWKVYKYLNKPAAESLSGVLPYLKNIDGLYNFSIAQIEEFLQYYTGETPENRTNFLNMSMIYKRSLCYYVDINPKMLMNDMKEVTKEMATVKCEKVWYATPATKINPIGKNVSSCSHET